MAEAHGWTPEQVGRMDPRFIQELFIQKEARADHQLFEGETDPKQAEAKRRKHMTQRKLDIMNRKEKRNKP